MAPPTPTIISTLVREHAEDIDAKGNRIIRHTATGARVVSRVDAKGRLLRQELTIGTEVIIWGHGTRVRTGILEDPSADAGHAHFDASPSRTRLNRARLSVEKYSGDDKYLQHLSRVVQLSAGLGLGGAEVVTQLGGESKRARKSTTKGSSWPATIAIAIAAVAVFVLVFTLMRR